MNSNHVYLVCTGETYEGKETYTRHEGSPPPLSDYETLYAAQPPQEPAGYLAFQEGDGKGVFFPTMVHMTSGTMRWHPPVSRVVPLYATPQSNSAQPVADRSAEAKPAGQVANFDGWWRRQMQSPNFPDISQAAARYVWDAAAQVQPVSAEARDAARYRGIIADAIGANDFTTYQPSGYNGGDHVWIEFGFKHPKWAKVTKEDVDRAIDAAMGTPQQAEQGSKP